MDRPRFARGQRWVSNTEADLGLGVVERYEARRVHLFFPAAGEVRTYAADNAPISRVAYAVGDELATGDGAEFTVTAVREEEDGCLVYEGTDAGRGGISVNERDLNSFVRFSRPQERLFAGQIDSNARFVLRMDTREQWFRHQSSPAFGLLGPRVQLLPHQLYIASELARRREPRALLADEVGLGKTIEAGLVVHHRLLSALAARVLVVLPEHLVHQWLVEMLRRFNLQFTVLDRTRCEELEGAGEENPFESAQLVIVPLPLLAQEPRRAEQALRAGWDVIVVDEAHRLRWSEGQASSEYAVVDALGRASPGLLLLTGTPEQLGVEAHFARLRLLDPGRYPSAERLRETEAGYRELGELVEALRSGAGRDALPARLGEYLPGERIARLREAQPDRVQAELEAVVDTLLDRHGTGRALFRNTRATIGGFPERVLITYPLEGAPGYYRALSELEDPDPWRRLYPESFLGPGWTDVDPRVPWLVELLRTHRREKVLVICAHAATAQALEEHLRTRGGVRTAAFHEHMGLLARDRAAAYFTEEEDESAQALVASEIGSEGRNFQAARHLVLFDLPPEPDLLEQRIGRLDRIGQRAAVSIHVPYAVHSPQAVLVRWYHEGLGLFEAPRPGANAVVQALARRLARCLREFGDEAGLDRLVSDARAESARLAELLQRGRERLLEANSYRPGRAREVVSAVTEATHELELMDYMERVFDQFGVEQERHSQHAVVIRPGPHMAYERFPGLPEDGVVATFSRTQALAREDMHFLTWEHPMVLGAMDLVLHGGIGNTAVSSLKLPSIKAGVLLVEALFVLDCPGPARLRLKRYLADAVVRVLVSANGTDLSAALSARQLSQIARRVPLGAAQQLVRETRAEIANLLESAERRARGREAALVAAAVERAEALLGGEIERLRELAAVNPDVGPQELEHLESVLGETRTHLDRGRLVLDAVRVAVTV